MRKLLVLFSLLSLVACKEKDLTENNPAPDPENVILKTSFIYGDQGFSPDSMITNNLGLRFFISEAQLVMSDFSLVNKGDTVAFEESPFLISIDNTDQPIAEIPPGGYSAHYNLRLGLDSATSATISPGSLPEGNELKNSDVFRNDGKGVHNIIIKGRLIDPQDPTDTIGKIPLNYYLGTSVTSRVLRSTQRHFSVEKNSHMDLIMVVDLEPIFNDMDIETVTTIGTDPQNIVDYNRAIDMADSLSIELF